MLSAVDRYRVHHLISVKQAELKILTDAMFLLEDQPYIDDRGLDAVFTLKSNIEVRIAELTELSLSVV